jgi:hypothetical protein
MDASKNGCMVLTILEWRGGGLEFGKKKSKLARTHHPLQASIPRRTMLYGVSAAL